MLAGATAASLALGRFVFLPFQRDNVGRQGVGEAQQTQQGACWHSIAAKEHSNVMTRKQNSIVFEFHSI